MEVEKFIDYLYKEGYKLWRKYENPEHLIYGKVWFAEGYNNELQDWEEIHIVPSKGIAWSEHHTNRSIPGWHLCPVCGHWYTDNDAEYHEHENEDWLIYFD